jgi:hypothetical protein
MHDIIGSAGMLRGWVAVWTEQMLWSAVVLVVALTLMIVVEALIAARTQRGQRKLATFAADIAHNPPLG